MNEETQSTLAANMWTFTIMEVYLTLSSHYTDENHERCTSVLGMQQFPQNHTSENRAQVQKDLMED